MSEDEYNPTLTEILAALSASEDALENFDPEVLIGELEGKIDSIHFIIGKMEATAKHLKEMAQPLTEKAKAISNSRERLRQYVTDTMLKHSFQNLPGNTFKVSLATGHRKLKISSEREPTVHDFKENARFMKMRTTFEWDNEQIEKAFQAGEKLPDLITAKMVESNWVVFSPKVPEVLERKKGDKK